MGRLTADRFLPSAGRFGQMSADKERAGQSGRDSAHAPGASGAARNGSGELIAQRDLAVRSAAFAAVAIVLAVVAVWFVFSAVRGSGQPPAILAAPTHIQYTVKISELDRQKAQQMLQNDVVHSLAGNNKVFLRELPGRKFALCAGTFPSKDDPNARELLAKFRNYRLRGQKVFQSAAIWGFEP